jgi:hypothetical protein
LLQLGAIHVKMFACDEACDPKRHRDATARRARRADHDAVLGVHGRRHYGTGYSGQLSPLLSVAPPGRSHNL